MFKYTRAIKELKSGKRVARTGWNQGTALYIPERHRGEAAGKIESFIERKSFSGDMGWEPTKYSHKTGEGSENDGPMIANDYDYSANDWVIVPSTKCDECRFILPTCPRESKGMKKNDNTDKFNIIECKEFLAY